MTKDSVTLPRELLRGAEAKPFLEAFRSCKEVREGLAKYLEKELLSFIEQEEEIDIFQASHVLPLVAYGRGQRHALRNAIKLLRGV